MRDLQPEHILLSFAWDGAVLTDLFGRLAKFTISMTVPISGAPFGDGFEPTPKSSITRNVNNIALPLRRIGIIPVPGYLSRFRHPITELTRRRAD